MTDLILLQLKKFKDAINKLPTRNNVISEILGILNNDDGKSLSLSEGQELYNEFMGYIVRVYRVKAQATEESDREITADQIKSIVEIDGMFQTYFEDNLVVNERSPAVNKNPRLCNPTEEEFIESMAKAFGFSDDTLQRDAVFNKFMNIKHSLPNHTDYQPILDRIIEMDIEAFIDTLTPEEIAEIERLSSEIPDQDAIGLSGKLRPAITARNLEF